MKIQKNITIEVYVAPCLKCGCEKIAIGDSGYSSFNYGGGECTQCHSKVMSMVGCFPTKEEMIEIWNAENDINKIIEIKEKEISIKNGEINTLKEEIKKLKKVKRRKQLQPVLDKIKNKELNITDIEKQQQRKYNTGGVIVPKMCSCGKYKPRSTKGIIDSSCKNCGGQKKEVLLK